MKRLTAIFFILSNVVFANGRVILQTTYPEYITKDSSFQISIVPLIKLSDYSEIKLYILTDGKIELRKAKIRNDLTERRLEIQPVNYEKHHERTYMITLAGCDRDSSYLSKNQLVLNFKSKGAETSRLKFALELFKEGSMVKKYSSDQNSFSQELPSINLTFYKSQKQAGKSIQLLNGSEFSINLKDNSIKNNLTVEFWAKLNKDTRRFFNIKNNATDRDFFSILLNKFQMVTIPEAALNNEFTEYFIDETSWNHFLIAVDSESKFASLFINGSLIFSYQIVNINELKDISINFLSNTKSKISIDGLKIWDFNNNITLAFRNRNYNSYIADSSRAILMLSFDEENLQDKFMQLTNVNISSKEIRQRISTAPIFSMKPEISVKSYDSFYEITWFNREDVQVERYEVQKSYDGKTFDFIFSKASEQLPEKYYMYIDSRSDAVGIVYYRIMQINKDGSVVYSPQVKIGIGKLKQFNINQNYPNPFNPLTSIAIEVLQDSEFNIRVYDLVGKEVQQIFQGPLSAGQHLFEFDGTNLPSGIYFLEAVNQGNIQVIKMVLAK